MGMGGGERTYGAAPPAAVWTALYCLENPTILYEDRAGIPGAVFAVQKQTGPDLGQNGGYIMAGSVKATPPKRERRIGGTTYIVTSHFKEQGVTAADHVRRLLDTATKEQKIRKSF